MRFLSRRSLLSSAFAPAPAGPRPSPRQLAWHRMEVYGFLHFSLNTFTDKEWGYGDESPALFQPSAFDAGAIVRALKAGGMKGVILTCKHHDGFCLWPSRTTRHTVAQSPWRQGQGDVVRELSTAAAREGLKFGVYLSPWDRNHPAYGRPEYVEVYREQLRELLTGYGPVFEVWHDGANGGDGYYGGAREKRVIDKRTYYDWPKTWELVRKLQPDAVIFSDVGPDIRWVGNEKGYADSTCWATYDPVGEQGDAAAPGYTRYREGTQGHRGGRHWMPAECDVSIRPGWFWHEAENAWVKPPAALFDLYCRSVGHGASFLLNVPPDRRGLLHEHDVAALAGFGRLVRDTFARNLAEGTTPRQGEWRFPRPVTFDLIRLREDIRHGQRVDAFIVEREVAGTWTPVAEGTSIGACRIVRLPEPVTAQWLRLRFPRVSAEPKLAEFGLYQRAV